MVYLSVLNLCKCTVYLALSTDANSLLLPLFLLIVPCQKGCCKAAEMIVPKAGWKINNLSQKMTSQAKILLCICTSGTVTLDLQTLSDISGSEKLKQQMWADAVTVVCQQGLV